MQKNDSNKLLWKYTGLGFTFLAAIGISLFAGIKLDNYLKPGLPLLVWVLPLLFIIIILIKVIKDSNIKK